jgi:hypothetical protein
MTYRDHIRRVLKYLFWGLLIALLLLLTIPSWSIKWWLLFAAFVLAFIIAMPRQMRSVRLFSKITNLPSLVWRMIQNLAKLDRNNKDFTHTSHEA